MIVIQWRFPVYGLYTHSPSGTSRPQVSCVYSPYTGNRHCITITYTEKYAVVMEVPDTGFPLAFTVSSETPYILSDSVHL